MDMPESSVWRTRRFITLIAVVMAHVALIANSCLELSSDRTRLHSGAAVAQGSGGQRSPAATARRCCSLAGLAHAHFRAAFGTVVGHRQPWQRRRLVGRGTPRRARLRDSPRSSGAKRSLWKLSGKRLVAAARTPRRRSVQDRWRRLDRLDHSGLLQGRELARFRSRHRSGAATNHLPREGDRTPRRALTECLIPIVPTIAVS